MKVEARNTTNKTDNKNGKHMSKLAEEVAALKRVVSSLDKKSKAVSARMDNIEPSVVERYVESARKDAKEIHDKYRLLFLKQTVATEVLFLAKIQNPGIAGLLAVTVFRAFDEPDTWWREREDLELGQWVRVLIDLSENHKERVQEFQIPSLANIGREKTGRGFQ